MIEGSVRLRWWQRTYAADLLAVGLIVSAMLLLAPGARAGWMPPVGISETGEHVGVPRVVLDAAGDATAVWARWNGQDTVVESAYRPAGGSWQAPTDLSLEGEETILAGERDAYSPRLAVDAAGDTTVVWSRSAGTNRILIQAVYHPAGGSWQAPVDLGEMDSAVDPEPWVAADEAGDTTAVWKSGEVIESSYRPAGGSWEPSAALSAGESYVPQAAMDAQGDATVVWMHYDGSRYVVEGAYRPAGGGWGPPTVLSQPGEEGGDPQIALDGEGDTMVVWDGHPAGGEVVRAAYRPTGGSWQAPMDVSKNGDEVQPLHVAMDAHGDALLVWSDGTHEAGGYDLVQAAYRPAGGEWQKPTTLSENGEDAYPSDVVFDTQGNAAVVWERWNGSHDVVQADYRPAGGGWQEPKSLSEEGKDSTDAVVVLDAAGSSTTADGDATAVWTSSEGGCKEIMGCKEPPTEQVQAAGYDSLEPSEELEAPAIGAVGAPVTFSAPSVDVWSPVLSFGDGSEDAGTTATHTYGAPGEYTVTFSSTEVLGYRSSTQRRIVIEPEAAITTPPSQTGGGEPSQQQPGQGVTTAPRIQPGGPAIPAPLSFSVDPLRQTLRAIRKTRELRFACRMSEPGTCVVRTALGGDRVTLERAGEAMVTIRLTPRALLAIRRLHMLRLAFAATATTAEAQTATAGKLVAR